MGAWGTSSSRTGPGRCPAEEGGRKQITGLRHRLILDYLGVDVRMIWKVASVEVEKISEPLRSVLEELAKDEWPEAN